MENADAERVVAFSEFTAAEKSSFQDFRQARAESDWGFDQTCIRGA